MSFCVSSQSSSEPIGCELTLLPPLRVDGVLKRFIAIWRKTVAIESSILPASRFRRRRGSSSSASRRLNVSASPNTEAVSAVVSGVRVAKPERLREHAVQSVAELVREGQDRARSPVKFMRM